MQPVVKTEYRCEICDHVYETAERATKCESRTVHEDKGAKIGDVVRIKSGDGAGQFARVTDRYIIDMEWGHYAWERYWHTVGLSADMLDPKEGFSRTLTFDAYEVL